MALQITLDTIEGSSLEVGTDTGTPIKRFFRGVMVQGVTAAEIGANVSEALWKAQEAIAVAAAASPLASARADMLLTRIYLEPFSDTVLRGRILYERPQFGGGQPPSSYLIRDSGQQRSLETNRMPGTHEPLVCTFSGTIGSGSSTQTVKLSDRVTFTISAPLRQIIVSALIYGRPPGGGQDGITYTNNATWPTSAYPGGTSGIYPKPKGYWKLDRFDTAYAVWSGYYTLEAAATTKVTEDWSETGTLRNQQTGRYVAVNPTDLSTLLSPAYTFGPTYGNGILRVGFNPLLNFVSVFGF